MRCGVYVMLFCGKHGVYNEIAIWVRGGGTLAATLNFAVGSILMHALAHGYLRIQIFEVFIPIIFYWGFSVFFSSTFRESASYNLRLASGTFLAWGVIFILEVGPFQLPRGSFTGPKLVIGKLAAHRPGWAVRTLRYIGIYNLGKGGFPNRPATGPYC